MRLAGVNVTQFASTAARTGSAASRGLSHADRARSGTAGPGCASANTQSVGRRPRSAAATHAPNASAQALVAPYKLPGRGRSFARDCVLSGLAEMTCPITTTRRDIFVATGAGGSAYGPGF